MGSVDQAISRHSNARLINEYLDRHEDVWLRLRALNRERCEEEICKISEQLDKP
jgi:hypothetical protein